MPIIAELSADSGPTLDEIVTEIIAQAQGFAIAPDRFLALSADISATDLSFQVTGETSPGVLEIGDELILVSAFDSASSTVTVHPRGRGWQGSPAAAHGAGDLVIDSPALPRTRCTQLVNDVIGSLFPLVYGIATTETVLGSDGVVQLADDAEFVLDVRYFCNDTWERSRTWEAERSTSGTLTGNTVRIGGVQAGTQVQVVFAVRPEAFSSATARWSDTGLGLGLKDVVIAGVLAKFAQTLDLGRLTDRFTSPSGDAQQPQLGAGFAMARQLKTDYQAALDREAAHLRTLYPARAHFVR